MKEIKLKRATPQDVDKFIELEKSIGGLKVYSSMTDRDEALAEITNNIVYFIVLDNEIIGSVMYENKSEDHAYISGLVVDPKYQGRGLARKAMELIMEELKDKRKIDLVTHPENDKAINLYQSLGFTIGETKENYFGDGEPRIVMLKEKTIAGIGVLIQTTRSTFLFQERDENIERNPGMITPFGGGMDEGETPTACAVRELDEELELKVKEGDLGEIGIFESHFKPGTYIKIFLLKNIDPSSIVLHEGKNVKELEIEKALDNPKVTDFTKEILDVLKTKFIT